MNTSYRLEEFVARMTPEQYARLLAFAELILADPSAENGTEAKRERADAESAELLGRIQQGLPELSRRRLRELTQKSEAESLTPEERAEYIALAEQLEESDAARLQAVVKLAELRGVPPADLVKQLGLGMSGRV
jgi:hypothetical protein